MCKRGNPIRSDIQPYDEDARVYSCNFNADEFLPFSYNYWLLLGKKKIAKYSVFLVPSVGISGAEQCNCGNIFVSDWVEAIQYENQSGIV